MGRGAGHGGTVFDGYDLVVYSTVVSTFLRDPSRIGGPMLGGLLTLLTPIARGSRIKVKPLAELGKVAVTIT